jgi:rhamnosyltransferase
MKPSDILAVVVSYNGLEKTKQTVNALRAQVGHILIVDNGSAAKSRATVEQIALGRDVSVEYLGENRGVGFALNRGVMLARKMGFPWLLTMDQDSLVDGSMIRSYQAVLDREPGWLCLSPVIRGGRKTKTEGGVVGYAITSGNLVRVNLYDEVGLYDEGLFIDCIDFDFCLRVRRAGYAICRVSGASIQHQLGEPVDVPGLLHQFYSLHAPVRRYYMTRNYFYMVERYLLHFPAFIVKLGISQVLLALLIVFFDPDPIASYRAIMRGLADYLARREGQCV